jgi:glyoxylase-like metal-dependent hydrolase (beta-lactamase superfamily II)
MVDESLLTRREVLAAATAAAFTRLTPATIPGIRSLQPLSGFAPRLGPWEGTHYRFALGDFEVTMISDAGAMIDGPWPIVGEDRPAAEVEALMQQNLLPPKRFQPGFTPMLVNTGKDLILFDTGNGANGFVPRPAGGWLASHLTGAGFAPEQVTLVVLSHAHPDHVGGVLENGKPLFPRARYVIGSVEYDFWKANRFAGGKPESNEVRTAKLFATHLEPLAPRTTMIAAGAEVVPGIRAVAAYGHTPGHLAFHIESQGKEMLFWGDAAHHEVASLAHPEWHAFFDMDKEGGATTRKAIYAMAAADRLLVAGYHTSFPSLGYVQAAGTNSYRWHPLTYQMREP